MFVGRALDNVAVRYIARISFGIYIWHYVVLELVRRFFVPEFEQGGEHDPLKFVLVSLAIAAVSFAVGHLSFRFVENPLIRWARRRERGGRSAPTLSPAAG